MELKEKIVELRNQNKTYDEIKKILGCSKSTIAYHLSEGQKQKTLDRTHKSRRIIAEFLSNYKESRGCMDCGEMYPYFILQFDHIKEKSFQISNHRKYTKSLEKIKEEVEKCEVVCGNCHALRTYIRRMKDQT
jgi:predicted transcriptional regulator